MGENPQKYLPFQAAAWIVVGAVILAGLMLWVVSELAWRMLGPVC